MQLRFSQKQERRRQLQSQLLVVQTWVNRLICMFNYLNLLYKIACLSCNCLRQERSDMLLKDILALTRVLPCYPHGEGRGYQKLEFRLYVLEQLPMVLRSMTPPWYFSYQQGGSSPHMFFPNYLPKDFEERAGVPCFVMLTHPSPAMSY